MDEVRPIVHGARCGNCSAVLAGPYCAQCGQEAHQSARTVHALFHEAWHLVTHLDGRLWRTLLPLLLQPGRLTREYFADHRARYLPPFRLYFLISVAFFALASVATAVSNMGASHHEKAAAGQTLAQRMLRKSNLMNPQLAARLCERVATGVPALDQRLRPTCLRKLAEQGDSMSHAFGSFVPKMMFVFLPLMALVMLALYRNPPRYFIEHLVFFLHLQSNLFLAMILEMLLSAAADAWRALEPVAAVGGVVLFWYSLWYTCCALRGYYGQSWPRTFVKFVAVAVSYLGCFILALSGTMIISAWVA